MADLSKEFAKYFCQREFDSYSDAMRVLHNFEEVCFIVLYFVGRQPVCHLLLEIAKSWKGMIHEVQYLYTNVFFWFVLYTRVGTRGQQRQVLNIFSLL